MDFEVRCDHCGHVYSTEDSLDMESGIYVAVNFGHETACDHCKEVGISAYAGNRKQNVWHKIQPEARTR